MKRLSMIAVLALAAVAGRARAQAGMSVVQIDGIRVDGSVRDWRGAHFASVGDGPDASMRFALGHDEGGLYVAAEVWDDRLVRTPHPGAREDAVILTLAGRGRRGRPVDIYLFAGVSGRSAALAATAPVGSTRLRPLSGARVVEGPVSRGHGYTLEAFIPFAAVPGGAAGWQHDRGSIRLRDVDSEAHPEVDAEPALVPVDPRHLDALVPLVPSGGASGAVQEFLASRDSLGGAPHARSARRRRGRRAPGAGHPGGGLPGGQRPGLSGRERLRLPPAPGRRCPRGPLGTARGPDRRREVGAGRRAPAAQRAGRAGFLWQAVQLDADVLRPMFSIEVRKGVGGGSVEDRVRVHRARRGPPSIEVRAGRARGLDAESYQESAASDAEPILVPWGPVLARTYRWDGHAFARTSERANPRYQPPEERAPSRAGTPAPEPAPAAPSPPSTDALLAEFRRQRGISARARPRFRVHANLAGGREPETAWVFGRQLVAVGPGIHDGTSWLYYEIPAANDGDVLSVESADVTGDHRNELLFRVRQAFGDVTREVLLVHQLTDDGLPRLLEVEVARSQGDNSIHNDVRTPGGHLEIRPGRARGWSEASWRFTRDPERFRRAASPSVARSRGALPTPRRPPRSALSALARCRSSAAVVLAEHTATSADAAGGAVSAVRRRETYRQAFSAPRLRRGRAFARAARRGRSAARRCGASERAQPASAAHPPR